MNNLGQALLEYLLLMVFGVLLTTNVVGTLSESTSEKFGRLAHVLSINLSTGVCEEACFFRAYENDTKK